MIIKAGAGVRGIDEGKYFIWYPGSPRSCPILSAAVGFILPGHSGFAGTRLFFESRFGFPSFFRPCTLHIGAHGCNPGRVKIEIDFLR